MELEQLCLQLLFIAFSFIRLRYELLINQCGLQPKNSAHFMPKMNIKR